MNDGQNATARAQTKVLLESYYAAFNAADWPRFLSLVTHDVVHDVNQGRRENGAFAFGLFMERMERCYQEKIHDLQIFVADDGGRAAVEYIVDGIYKTTDEGLPEAKGQTYSVPGGAFFEIRGNRIARVTNYYNLEQWLEQVR